MAGSGCALTGSDFPDDFPHRVSLYADLDDWVHGGESVVIAPSGKIVAGPLRKHVGILCAEIDAAAVGAARRSFDVVGNYARPDVFQLHVNDRVHARVEFGALLR